MKKGQTNNLAGRPIGAKNRTTTQTRAAIVELLESRLPKINQRLDECEAKDELNILIKLLEFVIPKIREDVPADDTVKKPDFYSDLIIRLNRKTESK